LCGALDTTFLQSNILNLGITLPSGAYKIGIAAITPQGIISEQSDTWVLIKQPLWYETIWFDLLLWMALAFGVWRFVKARSDYRKLNIKVSELQLRALQTQINPHFIGNSINTIHQFFSPPDRIGLSRYIQLFTQLLRRTIVLSEEHFNRFEEEFAYDRDYLDMIKIRFKDQFTYQIIGEKTIPPTLLFPSMLLQPILENATIHGLSPEGDSQLLLEFSYNNDIFSCTVTDNGIGYNASKARVSLQKLTRKSKGLELVSKKVEAFNQLYNLGLKIIVTDMADENPAERGTRVEITYHPQNRAI
jgi:LytS/YehU family sensor histidine kinase